MIEFIRRHKRLFYWVVVSILVTVVLVIGCNSGGGGGGGGDDSQEDPVTNTETPNRILNGVRENTTAVGLSTFALGVNNKFPLEDNQQADGIGYKVVARAVRRIATNELYTFPERSRLAAEGSLNDSNVSAVISDVYGHQSADAIQVRAAVKHLIDSGHQVVHQIHVICGPCLRDGSDAFANSILGGNTRPEKFNDRMFNHGALQSGLVTLLGEVVSHAKLLESLGAEVYICPELEDNHESRYGGSTSSFQIYLNFLQTAGWTNSDGSLRRDRIVRNGGRIGDIQGIRYEKHPHSLDEFRSSGLRPGDFANMDGNSFYFNSDDNRPGFQFSEDDVRKMVEEAEQRNVIFYIWPSELQGLANNGRFNYSPIGTSSRDRAYILRKPKEMISILLKVSPDQVQVAP